MPRCRQRKELALEIKSLKKNPEIKAMEYVHLTYLFPCDLEILIPKPFAGTILDEYNEIRLGKNVAGSFTESMLSSGIRKRFWARDMNLLEYEQFKNMQDIKPSDKQAYVLSEINAPHFVKCTEDKIELAKFLNARIKKEIESTELKN